MLLIHLSFPPCYRSYSMSLYLRKAKTTRLVRLQNIQNSAEIARIATKPRNHNVCHLESGKLVLPANNKLEKTHVLRSDPAVQNEALEELSLVVCIRAKNLVSSTPSH